MSRAPAAPHPDRKRGSKGKSAPAASRRSRGGDTRWRGNTRSLGNTGRPGEDSGRGGYCGRQAGNALGSGTGAITAEFAVALPAVLLLLALLLSGAAAGVTQLRLEEAAHAGARALARGDDPAAVEGIVRTLAGTSATASVAADGDWLSVTVSDRVGGPMGATVPWTLTAKAATRSETPVASGAAGSGLTSHVAWQVHALPHLVLSTKGTRLRPPEQPPPAFIPEAPTELMKVSA